MTGSQILFVIKLVKDGWIDKFIFFVGVGQLVLGEECNEDSCSMLVRKWMNVFGMCMCGFNRSAPSLSSTWLLRMNDYNCCGCIRVEWRVVVKVFYMHVNLEVLKDSILSMEVCFVWVLYRARMYMRCLQVKFCLWLENIHIWGFILWFNILFWFKEGLRN